MTKRKQKLHDRATNKSLLRSLSVLLEKKSELLEMYQKKKNNLNSKIKVKIEKEGKCSLRVW